MLCKPRYAGPCISTCVKVLSLEYEVYDVLHPVDDMSEPAVELIEVDTARYSVDCPLLLPSHRFVSRFVS